MTEDRFARIGGNLSADFANTAFAPQDDGRLHTARDVVDFLVATEALAASDAASLRRSLADPATGTAFLTRALALREAVTNALVAIEATRALDDASLAVLNATLESDAGFDRIERVRGARYTLAYRRIASDGASVLAPIARDAARLLATPGVPVRTCAANDCSRHFYDDSRTGRRRWCEMAICGNRAKAAAFAARRKA